ncbi:MAG: hypothetical protein KAR16_14525 [Bacteroidales bacterium]|nr:hypothetical protein [Bacteroidales bacterium]
MNKKISRIFIALLLAMMIYGTQDISAQIIEINGFTGIQLGGTAKLYDGDFRINDAQNYGGKLAVGLSTTTFAELSYMRADTDGTFYPFIGTPSDVVRFSSNYIQAAGLQQVDFGRVSPFATIGLGVTWWSPKSSQLNSKVQFSATVGAGLKLWLTDMIGIRLQGTMLMPMVYNGAGFGCGIGTGGSSCGANLYTRITPFQGEFSGGLIIKLSPN